MCVFRGYNSHKYAVISNSTCSTLYFPLISSHLSSLHLTSPLIPCPSIVHCPKIPFINTHGEFIHPISSLSSQRLWQVHSGRLVKANQLPVGGGGGAGMGCLNSPAETGEPCFDLAETKMK